ncbi:hypothetical protein [Tropicibacter sp. S64]|uniref:hypothetical protein n=1 Tax=Tropicibacter sp. S64 TaxID=3415122 RepID=UPI003C79FBE0
MGEITFQAAFANAFWVFVGVVAGALIQSALGFVERNRQGSSALQVLQIEAQFNLEELQVFKDEIARQKVLLTAGEINSQQVFFPMASFDYSALGPVNNSGYLHLLLGSDLLKELLSFSKFFNNRNGEILHAQLQQEAAQNRSVHFLDRVEKRASELEQGLMRITQVSKRPLSLSVTSK